MMMKRTVHLLLMAAVFAVSMPALAQTSVNGMECGVERKVPAGMLPEQTHNRLNRIYEQIGEEQYDEAYPALERLLDRTRDDYVRATILQAMGHIRAQQERYRDAIDLFTRTIELNRMPNPQHFDLILQTAQLYYTVDDFERALQNLDLWFCLTPSDQQDQAQVWIMKASIHAHGKQFREAIQAVDRAIELTEEPREDWYRLKLGMHFELQEFAAAADVLQILIRLNPTKKDYWVQLSSVYVELKQNRNSMAVLSLAHREGLLDRQAEYLQLASLQQEFRFPRKAAEVLEQGLEAGILENTRRNWEMAGGAWYEARELDKALRAYERAGAQSSDGKIDFQRAAILTDLERWEESAKALARALELGGLSENQTGNAWLLLGMARFNLEDSSGALEAFNRAMRYGNVRRAADEWAKHVRRQSSSQS